MNGPFIPGQPYRLNFSRNGHADAGRKSRARAGGTLALLVAAGLLLFGGSSALPNDQFAYSSNEWGDYDLFIHTMEGEYIAMLTFSTGTDIEPAFSHDGNYLFYSANSWENYYFDIKRMVPPWAYDPNVQPSFDLEDIHQTVNLTFPSSDDGGADVLYHCALDLCTDWVALHSNLDGDYDLYMMDLTGNVLHQLTNDPADEVYPSWSPDGTQIAFMSNESDPYWNIYVLDLRSGDVRQYTDSVWIEDYWPAWSPDGKTIAYMSSETAWYRIWLMDADCSPGCGANKHLLLPLGQYEDEVHEFDASWSPDSRWILFSSYRDPASQDPDQQVQFDYEIFAVTRHGAGLTQLTTNDFVDDFTPAWRPGR